MRPGGITALRWSAVALYALLTWMTAHDGVSHFEIVELTIVGCGMFTGIVLADWINAPSRHRSLPVGICGCGRFVCVPGDPYWCRCGHDWIDHSIWRKACQHADLPRPAEPPMRRGVMQVGQCRCIGFRPVGYLANSYCECGHVDVRHFNGRCLSARMFYDDPPLG